MKIKVTFIVFSVLVSSCGGGVVARGRWACRDGNGRGGGEIGGLGKFTKGERGQVAWGGGQGQNKILKRGRL